MRIITFTTDQKNSQQAANLEKYKVQFLQFVFSPNQQ